jgi:hypothetical protein
MGQFRATKNLKLGDGKDHVDVKKGEIFECDDEYAKTHLVPHGHVEEPDAVHEREEKAHEEEATKLEKKAEELKGKAADRRAKKTGKKAEKKGE